MRGKRIVTAHDVIAARRKLGMNQVELSRATGFSTSQVSQVETGLRNPGKRFAAAVEDLLLRAEGGQPLDHEAALEDAINRIFSLESRVARLERFHQGESMPKVSARQSVRIGRRKSQ